MNSSAQGLGFSTGILCGSGRTDCLSWFALAGPGGQIDQLRTNVYGDYPVGCVNSSSKPQVMPAWEALHVYGRLCIVSLRALHRGKPLSCFTDPAAVGWPWL